MSGPRIRKSQVAKQEAYRALVLEAAARLFAERGFDDTKIDEIAREAEVAPGTLYSVFRSKQAILHEIVESGMESMRERAAGRARAASTPFASLLASLRGSQEYFVEHPDFLRIQLWEGRSWSAEKSARGGAWRIAFNALCESFSRCIEAGVVHRGDPALYARMTLAMQESQLAHWIESEDERTDPQVVQELLDLVERTFQER